jgi:predicted ribonuclease YlaK
MHHTIGEMCDEIERLREESKEIHRRYQELMDKVKKDQEALEFMVDRRIINKFLINYANPLSSTQVKL